MKPKYWNKGKLYLSNKDKVLKKIIDEFPNQSLQLNNNSFQALVNSIIGQQISVSAANSDRKSTRLNSSHSQQSRMPSSA